MDRWREKEERQERKRKEKEEEKGKKRNTSITRGGVAQPFSSRLVTGACTCAGSVLYSSTVQYGIVVTEIPCIPEYNK